MIKQHTLPSALKGEILPLYLWLPQGEPKGLVQLVHGMAEHIDRYDEAARFLCGEGWAVVGHTHCGHGPDASRLGYFGHPGGWDNLLKDIHQVRKWAQAQVPDVPYVILGHSMGSFLARCYITRHSRGVSGAVLSGTGYYPKALTLAGKALTGLFIALGRGLKPSPFIGSLAVQKGTAWLSRDEAVQQAYEADPLCGFLFTVYGYRDLFTGLGRLADPGILKTLPNSLPVYLFSGDQDPVGQKGEGVQKVAQEYRNVGLKKVDVKLYPEGRHEMFNELNRQEVFRDLAQWLNALM